MGVNRVFWPQTLLDQWIVDEKIVLENDTLVIREKNQAYKVFQAVFFETDVGDGSDTLGLIGRVKEVVALDEMGAEHYMDSVLIGDAAYQVVPGFIGTPVELIIQGSKVPPIDISGAIATHTGDNDEDTDRELLARFLIENL